MPPKKTHPLLLIFALLALGLTNAHADAEPTNGRAPRTSAQNREAEALAQNSSDGRLTSRPHDKGVFDSFDGFPAKAAKREIQPRAVSASVAAQLAARMPQYTPPPEPKKASSDAGPTSPAQNEQVEDLDQPRNQILRLPDYIVREKKSPVLRERDIHSPSGLAALAASRYLSETGQALNRYTIPFLGNAAQAYALARYEEDERLRTIRDLSDTARDLSLLQGAETAASPISGNGSRRSSDAEANLRRLIRDTTSRRATEPPTKLAQ